jgi:hypothetical protein
MILSENESNNGEATVIATPATIEWTSVTPTGKGSASPLSLTVAGRIRLGALSFQLAS